MFESLRKNIQTVQEGISAGLQRLSVGDKTPTTPTESNVNLGAGADLLQMYQTQWTTMHHIAEQNSKLAEVLDGQITELKDECESQHSKMSEIHSLLAHLPNIMSQLHSMLATIGSVRGLFEEVEGEMLVLEDLLEELEVQESTLDFRLGLALSRERHSHHLTELRKQLSSKHEVKMLEVENKKEKERQEREAVFADQFHEDIKEYKQTGQVLKKTNNTDEQELKLEDVNLDEDTSDLDNFLNDPA